jgi:hypothetical protein
VPQVEFKRIPRVLCRAYNILQLPVTRERLAERVTGHCSRVDNRVEVETTLRARLVRIAVDGSVKENIARSRDRRDPSPCKLVLYGQAIGTYLRLFKVLILDVYRRDSGGRYFGSGRTREGGINQRNRHSGRVVERALA